MENSECFFTGNTFCPGKFAPPPPPRKPYTTFELCSIFKSLTLVPFSQDYSMAIFFSYRGIFNTRKPVRRTSISLRIWRTTHSIYHHKTKEKGNSITPRIDSSNLQSLCYLRLSPGQTTSPPALQPLHGWVELTFTTLAKIYDRVAWYF